MKKIILGIAFCTLFMEAKVPLSTFIERVKKLSYNAPEIEYENIITDLHDNEYDLIGLMVATVQKIKNEAWNKLLSRNYISSKFKNIKKNGRLNKEYFYELLNYLLSFKKSHCRKPMPSWELENITIQEKLEDLVRTAEPTIKKVFQDKFQYLDRIIFTPKTYAGIHTRINLKNKYCSFSLYIPISYLKEPYFESVLTHELTHLIRNHTLEQSIPEIIIPYMTYPQFLISIVPLQRAQEIEADAYSYLLNLNNAQRSGERFKELLPWDSKLFMFFYNRGYRSLSKIIDLLNMTSILYLLTLQPITHPLNINRFEWARKWQRLIEADLNSHHKLSIQAIAPKDLNKRIQSVISTID